MHAQPAMTNIKTATRSWRPRQNVSIRLRLTSRRKPPACRWRSSMAASFQSASGSPAGGNQQHECPIAAAPAVSIRLRLTSRRNKLAEDMLCDDVEVSIRLRLTSRRKRPAAVAGPVLRPSFNPPPAHQPEETQARAVAGAAPRFQSASGSPAGGNGTRRRPWSQGCTFQSASGSPAGGNGIAGYESRDESCRFNPPPAHQPEETRSMS